MNHLWQADLKSLLEIKAEQYNRPEFIESDPIQVPHLFTLAEDIEIAGFLTAVLAWGNRKTIIKKSMELMRLMDNRPCDFITGAGDRDMKRFESFCHRTFNATDTLYFLNALKILYTKHGGLRQVFEKGFSINHSAESALVFFRSLFLSFDAPEHTYKHLPDVLRGSAAKRINLFLRWMVRNDGRGVDFGIWNNINPAWLCMPLDIHSGITARRFELLSRKQNDWKSVQELTHIMIGFDPLDPVKYDFALYGMSAFQHEMM